MHLCVITVDFFSPHAIKAICIYTVVVNSMSAREFKLRIGNTNINSSRLNGINTSLGSKGPNDFECRITLYMLR